MTLADNTVQVLNSPFVVAMVSVAATAFVGAFIAAIKVVVDLAQIHTELKAINLTLTEMKTDPDVMRWSNYGRASQAFQQAQINPGGQP